MAKEREKEGLGSTGGCAVNSGGETGFVASAIATVTVGDFADQKHVVQGTGVPLLQARFQFVFFQ